MVVLGGRPVHDNLTNYAEFSRLVAEQADVVIYDSPPAATVTDAVVLSPQVDGVIQVVQAGRTRRDVVVRAKGLLEKVGAHLLGPVLNQVSLGDMGYYTYYYAYGYGHEGDERGKRARLRRLLGRHGPPARKAEE